MGKNKTPGTKRDATDGVRQKRGGGKREKRQQDAVIPKSVLIADGVIDVKKTKNRSRTAKKQRQAQKATSDDIIKKMEAELSSDEEVEEEVKEESKEEEVVVEAVVSAGKTKLGLMEDDDDEEENDEPELGSDSEDEIDADVAEDMLGEELMSDDDADDDKLTKIGKKTDKIGEMIKEGKDSNIELHIDTLDELPTKAELENNNLTDVDVLQDRIRRNIATLKAFSKHRNEKYSRTEYLTVLKADLCSYYGYNDYLMGMFMDLLPLDEMCEFLDANEKPRPTVIRTNTLKARRRELAQALIHRGVNLDPLEWSKEGLVVHDSTVPIGATPEYLSGHYMLQGACSQLPVMALAPKKGERVLDVSAAPGGKTTHMAAMMRNSGTLVANDANKERQKSTIANLHRLNCCNSIVSVMDGRDLAKTWGLYFNKVLLDAPCSGTGVISKDPAVKLNKAQEDIRDCAFLQKELIIAAVDSLNANTPGGAFMVYCTCSLMVAENEEVVDYILRKRNVKIVDAGLPIGEPGLTKFKDKKFDPSLKLTRRFYPHKHNTDGFYVCKLQKMSNEDKLVKHEVVEKIEEQTTKKVESKKKHETKIKEDADKKKKRQEHYEQKMEKIAKKKTKKENKKKGDSGKKEAKAETIDDSMDGAAEAKTETEPEKVEKSAEAKPATKAAKSKATKAKSPKKDVSPAKTARAKRSAKKQ